MTDLSKFADAIAKMRRPRILLNPVDCERLRSALVTVPAGHCWFSATGIEIQAADEVPVGKMMAVEMDEPPIGPLVPFTAETR